MGCGAFVRAAFIAVRNALAEVFPCLAPPYDYTALSEWVRSGTPSEQRAEAAGRIVEGLAMRPPSTALELGSLGLREAPPIPRNILHLVLDDNALERLPRLPPNLVALNCANNQLRELRGLPPFLQTLDCSGNALVGWPHVPPRLHELDANRCGLATVAWLPGTLQYLNLRHNDIARLPALPPHLMLCDMQHNRLAGLPQGVERLPLLFFDLRGNNLDPATLNQIDTWNALRDRLVFLTVRTPDAATVRTPDAALASVQRAEQADALDPEAAFDRLMDRLEESTNQSLPFREELDAFRERVKADPDLRDRLYAIAAGGNASCEDRNTLLYYDMLREEANYAVEAGRLDHDVDRIIAILRHNQRQVEVDRIAWNTIQQARTEQPPRRLDEVETILHLRLLMGDLLAPPGGIHAGRYTVTLLSGITQGIATQARERLGSMDAELDAYLANSAAWQAVLERWNPDAVAAAREHLADTLSDPDAYSKHVEDYLRAEHPDMVDDPDAQVQAGPAVLQRLTHAAFGPLTNRFKAEREIP